jgi:hypothetical protein
MHTNHVSLGINHPVILDYLGFQGVIDYRLFRTPRDVYDRFRALGVTHVAWVGGRSTATRQEEILFGVFVELLHPRQQFGEYAVAPMPASPPPVENAYEVLVAGVSGLPDGLYPIESLSSSDLLPPAMRFNAGPRKGGAPATLLGEARVVLIGASASIDAATNERLNREFRPIQVAGSDRVLLRR